MSDKTGVTCSGAQCVAECTDEQGQKDADAGARMVARVLAAERERDAAREESRNLRLGLGELEGMRMTAAEAYRVANERAEALARRVRDLERARSPLAHSVAAPLALAEGALSAPREEPDPRPWGAGVYGPERSPELNGSQRRFWIEDVERAERDAREALEALAFALLSQERAEDADERAERCALAGRGPACVSSRRRWIAALLHDTRRMALCATAATRRKASGSAA